MTTNLLPKLNNEEYELMLSCLATGGDGECDNEILLLISKITDGTIESNTYARTEGC